MSRPRDLELKESILKTLLQADRPLSIAKLTSMMGLASHAKRSIRRLAKELVLQGKVSWEGRGRYAVPSAPKEVAGTLGKPRGKFFPVLSDDNTPVMELHPRQLNGALPGDAIVAQSIGLGSYKGLPKGRVVSIQRPGKRIVVGVLHRQARVCFVLPDDERFSQVVSIENPEDCASYDGQVVAVRVHPTTGKLRGEFFRLLGPVGEFSTELERLFLEHCLENDFPKQVQAELAAGFVDTAESDRVDLTDLEHVTVDPIDAKDFDDAVFVQSAGSAWSLWVSIADVSAFVPAQSAIDQEAARRAFSTYMPGRVFPMLPGVLSEGVCSLSPDKDKAAITVQMDVAHDGRVQGGKVTRSRIRSAARLSYEQVQRVFDGDGNTGLGGHLVSQIKTMGKCAGALLARMKKRGQILFDLPEIRFGLNDDGRVLDAAPSAHGLANRMIEAFMVAANEALGALMNRLDAPVLYRIHEQPDGAKMQQFLLTAKALGCKPGFGPDPEPAELASFLGSIGKKTVGPALSQLLLKSLMQAKYSVDPKEHFGLATRHYLHFTSPIRRYPDLLVHRQLAGLMDSLGVNQLDLACTRPLGMDWPLDKDMARQLATSCSKAERRAVAAERAAIALYQAAWAMDRLGEEFEAVVNHASDLGLFVWMRPSMVEGLVHISRLGGQYYDYDPEKLALVGRRSGKTFRVGQAIRVRILSANLAKRRVDLELA